MTEHLVINESLNVLILVDERRNTVSSSVETLLRFVWSYVKIMEKGSTSKSPLTLMAQGSLQLLSNTVILKRNEKKRNHEMDQ